MPLYWKKQMNTNESNWKISWPIFQVSIQQKDLWNQHLLSLFIFLSNSNFLSHTIHVWYIYLFMANVGKYIYIPYMTWMVWVWHHQIVPPVSAPNVEFPKRRRGARMVTGGRMVSVRCVRIMASQLGVLGSKMDSSERCRQGFVSKKSPAGPFLNGPRKNLSI